MRAHDGRRARLVTAALVAGAGLVVAVPAAGLAPAPYGPADVVDHGIDPASRTSVDQAFSALGALGRVATGWTGDVATCAPGQTSQAANTAAFDAINLLRELAGLDPVTESQAASEQAQQAALIMSAAGRLTHTPTSDLPCWTADGATGAGTSNLSLGYRTAVGGVLGQMYDAGTDNVPVVGHRRWLLRPTVRTMGVGQVSDATSVVVLGDRVTTDPAQDDRWIPWPAAGYFPAPLVPASSSWSLSRDGADFSAAAVTVTRNGVAVAATAQPVVAGAGVSSLVFTVDGDETAPPGAGVDTYDVLVTGIGLPGGSTTSHGYTVEVFRPSASLTARLSGTVSVGGLVRADLSGNPVDELQRTAAPGESVRAFADGTTFLSGATYQWFADGVAIPGATHVGYFPTAAQRGRALTVAVSHTGGLYADWTATAGPVTVGAGTIDWAGPVAVVGTATVGRTLTADVTDAGGAAPYVVVSTATSDTGYSSVTRSLDLGYQWLRDGAVITSATKATYTAVAADAGRRLSVRVTARLAGYADRAVTSAATPAIGAGALTSAKPTISGTARVGRTLTARPGTWKAGSATLAASELSYQWLRGTTPVKGATGSTYVLVAADRGKAISVRVTGARAGYATASKTSSATAKVTAGTLTARTPTISGTAKVGKKLTAKPGTWQAGSARLGAKDLTYQWYRGSSAIKGATKSTYTLRSADKGKTVKVKVTGRKSGYTTVAKTSKATAKVKAR